MSYFKQIIWEIRCDRCGKPIDQIKEPYWLQAENMNHLCLNCAYNLGKITKDDYILATKRGTND
jgi:formylmethanofuran dehydrogenase subunit E